MAGCARIEKCLFFNDRLEDTPNMADYLKRKYCQGDSTGCARLMIAAARGPEAVPPDLFPGDSARATALLSE